MTQDIFDVIVIGAGPGGAETAYQLARRGIGVAALEKGPLYREKSCGGGIQTQEIVELGRPPEEAIERWISTARMYSSTNEPLEIPQLAGLCGATVKRAVFDCWLQDRARAAGAVLFDHHAALDIECHRDHARLTVKTPQGIQEMRAQLVVYAAGAKSSPLRRKLGGERFDPERLYAATQTWIELSEEQVNERVGDTIELYGGSTVIPEGYGWIFPKRRVLSVGLGTSHAAVQRLGLNLRDLLHRFMEDNPVVRDKLAGGRILHTDGGLIPARCLDRLVYPRTILLGDAAGVGNALHGGGIYQARKCAVLAAPKIQEYLEARDESALLDYEDQVKERFWAYEGKWDNKLVRFFHKDILLDSAISLAHTKPKRELTRAFSIILNSTESHEGAYYIFEKAMLDIVYKLFEDKAKPYRGILEARLAKLGYRGPLLTPSVDHVLFADAKRFRATLAFLAYEMYGRDLGRALPVAAAYELLHTASLIHDDIMDNASMRRGKTTVHAEFGVGAAITSGDLLIFEAFKELLQASWEPSVKARVCALFSESGIKVSEGQGMDLHLSRRFDAWSVQGYLQMIRDKTGSLISSPLLAGAILGGAPETDLERIARIGTNLGMAFQIIDDSNDLLGSEDTSLKALYGDLREGKCTAIMARCWDLASPSQRAMIRQATAAKELSADTLYEVLGLFRSVGAIAHSQALCGELATESRRELLALPEGPARSHLQDINDIIDDWCALGHEVKPIRRQRPTHAAGTLAAAL